MTTIKELNKKIESLTKEVKDLQAKADEERESYQHKFINLPVTRNTNKYLTEQVQITTGVIQK